MKIKKCSKCKSKKPTGEFSRDATSKDGLHCSCKSCHNECVKKWRSEHKEHIRKYNAENRKEYRKKYYTEHQEQYKKWRADHKEQHKIYVEDWRLRNAEKSRAIAKRYYNRRVKTTRERISKAMSSNINRSLREGAKAGRHWENIVGYSIDQLKKHLEKYFEPWMTWENYGQWHIDHRVPVSAFNFVRSEDIDFKRCWALNNLRPLGAIENIRKSNKLCAPFQPALLM